MPGVGQQDLPACHAQRWCVAATAGSAVQPCPCDPCAALLAPGALWSLRCCVPFIAATVSERRRALAVYPVLLMYTTLAWLALLKG